MRLSPRFIPAVLATLFMASGSAHASFISMVTDHTVETRDDSVIARIKVSNQGDEAAYNVQVSAQMEGEVRKGPLQNQLNVNESVEVALEFPHHFKKPGKYPVIVSVDYTDLNRYPFTAISIGEADYKERLLGRVSGTIQAKPFSKSGKILVNVKNLDQKEQRFDLRLILPREFSSPREADSISVLSGEEGRVTYPVKNISALQNSRYKIFVLVSYEDDDKHYMHPLAYTLEIVPFRSFVGRYYAVFGALAFILLVIVVTINLRKRSRPPSLP